MSPGILRRTAAICALLICAAVAYAQDEEDAAAPAAPVDPKALATTISGEVAQIRGLPFKHPVGVEMQSTERFGKYVTEKIDEEVPPAIQRHYGQIVRTLGLYRGPPIDDFPAMMKTMLVSQAGAYYDPEKKSFYVLMTRMPEMMQGAMYSHELYHALQDQYFGLAPYLQMDETHRSLDSDQQLARQAVVEGEATYMMTLWIMQKMMKTPPPREMLGSAIEAQANLSVDQLRGMLQQPALATTMGEDFQDAIRSTDKIPPFLLEEMMSAYLKGMSFVFAVQGKGWPTVEKLYKEYPPQSTEQILHPEKWLAREKAVKFQWPDFTKVESLRNWELLDSDVLGEFRWRTVLKEHGLNAEAESIAAGWGGDRYAVFKRKDSDAMLLLLRTSWDSEGDAKEFVAAYRRVLGVKYANNRTPTRVVQDGVEVFVVEGGNESDLDALVSVVKQASKQN